MLKLFEKIRQLAQRVRQSVRRVVDKSPTLAAATAYDSPLMDEPVTINEAIVKELMRRLQATQEGVYSCEETFALLDEYVELVAARDTDAAALMPLVRNHIEMCPDCREACEMLLRILEVEGYRS